jgi:hypothetical protein
VKKKAMIEALERKESDASSKRITIEQSAIANKKLHDFGTQNTRNFFHTLSISDGFLSKYPDTWVNNELYLEAESVVREL